jgi:hypothetical protein
LGWIGFWVTKIALLVPCIALKPLKYSKLPLSAVRKLQSEHTGFRKVASEIYQHMKKKVVTENLIHTRNIQKVVTKNLIHTRNIQKVVTAFFPFCYNEDQIKYENEINKRWSLRPGLNPRLEIPKVGKMPTGNNKLCSMKCLMSSIF